MTPESWPDPDEVVRVLGQRGTPVAKATVEVVMDATWGLILQRRTDQQRRGAEPRQRQQ